MRVRTVGVDAAVRLHDRALDVSGGLTGIRDASALMSAVERPHSGAADVELYPTVFLKAAAVAHGIATSHPLVEGNKRAALLAASATLQINDIELRASPEDEVHTMLALARHEMTLEDFASWLEQHSAPLAGHQDSPPTQTRLTP